MRAAMRTGGGDGDVTRVGFEIGYVGTQLGGIVTFGSNDYGLVIVVANGLRVSSGV